MAGGKRSTTENPAENDAASVADEAGPAEDVERVEVRAARSAKQPAFVQYIGGADVREIAAKDWANVGVEDQQKVVWDKRKFRGDRVPVDQLSAGALEYCATYDTGFRLIDEDGKPV